MNMSQKHLDIIRMRDHLGYTFIQIADRFNIRRQTARTAYERAKMRLSRAADQSRAATVAPSNKEQRMAARRRGRSDRLMGIPLSAGYGGTVGEFIAWYEGWKDADKYLTGDKA